MWGLAGGGRDSQPSPTPGEGPITHEYIVIPTNYMLYIKRQVKRRGEGRRSDKAWMWTFIYFFIHYSTRVYYFHLLPAIYLCT